jgi:hypothetical protein
MQFQNHHQFSKSDHRASLQPGGNDVDGGADDLAGASPGKIISRLANSGIFNAHFCGELQDR